MLILLLVLAAAGAPAAMASISVHPDHDPVSMDESFQITFTAKGSVDGDPDFSPLDQDFQVLSTSQSSNFSVINGSIESSKSWTVTVLPRHTGKLTIPPISFGADRSPSATVQVSQAAASSGQDNDAADIFLEAQVSTTKPYVQSQVLYTLRLYRAVATAGATLAEPQPGNKGDAVIEHLDEDNKYQTRVNGKQYLVVERTYAVYPQTSGKITIGPVKFEGQVARNSFSVLDPFGPKPSTIVRQSAPVTLNVRPVPAAFPGQHWLPARQVSLTSKWSSKPPTFRVGDPVTRTLILTADGQTSSQLPVLPDWVPDGFRKYPDQPQLKDDKSSKGIIGSRVEKTALIPKRAGDFVLPAISIPWWNTTTGKLEHATLPARHITVAPAAGQSGTNRGQAAPLQPAPLGKLQKPGASPPQANATPPAAHSGGKKVSTVSATAGGMNPWLLLSLGLAAIWLVTVLAWWVSSRRRHGNRSAGGADSLRRVRGELRQACLSHAPGRVRELLLRWGRLTWPANPPANLGEIGERSHPALAEEIRRLNQALYGNAPGEWRGDTLWQAFEHAAQQRRGKKREEEGRLEPLYRL